ncbi:MAG: hypothetical protein RIT81_10805 [Deltaproteobacteria bacterium]
MNALLAIALLAVAAPSADDVQRMIDAGRLDDAAAAIEELDPRLQDRLQGVLLLARDDAAGATAAFARALEATPDDARLLLHASHAALLADRPDAALDFARRAEIDAVAKPLLMARALRRLDRLQEAFEVLSERDEPRILLERTDVAMALGLEHHALTTAQTLVELGLDRAQTLALFHVFEGSRRALPMLETAAHRFEDDAEIWAHLGIAYGVAEAHHVAAHLFERATQLGGDYAFEAADQYRVTGEYEAALRWNARVEDAKRRDPQRIEILFDRKSYARVVASSEVLPESALESSVMRYRLAYANFALGTYDRATKLARTLEGTRYEGAARSLLDAMGRR